MTAQHRFKDLDDESRVKLIEKMRTLRRSGQSVVTIRGIIATEDSIIVSPELIRQYTQADYQQRAVEIKEAEAADPITAEQKRLQDRELLRQLTQLQRTEAKRQEYKDTISTALSETDPLPPVDYTPVSDGVYRSLHKWVIVLSDWHIGQRTPIEHTGGIYEQNLGLTRWQVDRLLTALKSIHETESHGQHIDEVMILCCGDIVEGDAMRPAQLRQIELPVTKQAVEAYRLLATFTRGVLALPGIERVTVHFVGGNHDRTSSKAGNAGLGETDYVDTYSWIIGAIFEEALANEPRLRVVNWETFYGYTEFGGKRFVFEHGASFKTSSGSYGGIGWYPIMNAAGKYKDMLDGSDFVVMGHFHVPAVLPTGRGGWVVMNGALPATTHYVQSNFKAIREPTQVLLDLHGDFGLVSMQPLYAVPETLLSEGEAWTLARERTAKLWTPDASVS